MLKHKLISPSYIVMTLVLIFVSIDLSSNSPASSAPTTTPKFLTLPFTDPDVKLQQGYIYVGLPGPHEGIDYIKGTIDQTPTWQSFNVQAAADGVATYSLSDSWGNYVYIRHIINGEIFYTLYAHLQSSDLPLGQPTQVVRGSVIGVAGRTGTGAHNIIHLHFEFSKNNIGAGNRYDAYDLYQTREYYPGWRSCPCLGANHYWTTDPPSMPGPVGTIGGLVKDSRNGMPVSGADVKFVGGGTVRNTQTDSNGHYNFDFVPAGNARITAIAGAGVGYKDVTVRANQSTLAPDILLYLACMPGYVAAKGGPSTPLLPDSCGTPTDDAAYVADITLPDGTVVSPGQNATKTWQLRNSGTSTWGTGYQLAFVNGNQLGAPASVSVPAAAPGQLANVSVPLQIPANITGGTYQGNWRMRNASGTYFGDTIYVRVSVSQAQPTPPGGGGGGNGVNVDLVGIANSPSAPDPGQRFQPEITVRVTSGQLLASRGDLLRLYSGTNYTSPSFPHVAVQGTINSGQTFTFRFYDDHPMVAPTAPGTYEGVWRVWANSGWVGPEIPIRFTVGQPNQGHPPNAPNLVSPYDWQLFVGQTPQLCAHDNGDPDGDAITGYHFVVWSSVGGTRDSGWVSGSCWTPPNLGNYGWTWHAQVQDSRGLVSDWSPTWHFNLESSTVTITDMHFDPASPSNGQTITCYACTSGCGGVGVTLKVLVNTATDGSANGQWIILKELVLQRRFGILKGC